MTRRDSGGKLWHALDYDNLFTEESRRTGREVSVAKVKVPKKVGGFKVPKAIRKSRTLRKMLASPQGRELLTGALVAGATAVASSLTRDRPGGGRLAAKAAAAAKDGVSDAAETIAAVVNAVASRITSAGNAGGANAAKPKKRSKKPRPERSPEPRPSL